MTQPTTEEKIVDYPLDMLDDSPFQPRTFYDQAALEETANTMRPPHGRVQQPIVARLVNGRGEIVFGHRRTRSARIAELGTIPTIFRELTDEQVKVAQIVENLQRRDISPLDEADAMHLLRIEHKASIEDLMERSGASRSYVYDSLRLATASPFLRASLSDGSCDRELAKEVARLPNPLQEKALRAVRHLPTRVAKQDLRASFQFNLARAPFDVMSLKLLPSAGACDACPKRSDAEPVLLESCGQDVCMDGECYGKKAAAHREAEEKKAKAAEAKAKKGAPPPAAEIVGQAAWPFPRAAGSTTTTSDQEGDDDQDTPEEIAQEQDARAKLTPQELAVHDNWHEIRLAMMRHAVARPRTTDDMRYLLERELDLGDSDFGEAEKVLGWDLKDGEAARRAKLAEMTADELGTLLMLVALQGAPWAFEGTNRAQGRITLAERFGIDVLTASPVVTEIAPTPSPAARAPKKAKAAQAPKKAKAAPKVKSKREEQKDEAGSAGDRDPLRRDMLAEAGL